MRRAVTASDVQPMSEMNTTPLIDVMLVLLIMLIITIPLSTSKLPIDLPNDGVAPVQRELPHRLDIAASGALAWDGRAIGDAELGALLATTAANEAVLTLKADAGARYERFHAILAQAKRAGITKLGFVGNEQMKM
jgi:biopolymer transport protein ExbD